MWWEFFPLNCNRCRFSFAFRTDVYKRQVDIVETGTTLRENNLEVIETVVPISARLIANKVSYKFNNARIRELCDRIAENLEKKTDKKK